MQTSSHTTLLYCYHIARSWSSFFYRTQTNFRNRVPDPPLIVRIFLFILVFRFTYYNRKEYDSGHELAVCAEISAVCGVMTGSAYR